MNSHSKLIDFLGQAGILADFAKIVLVSQEDSDLAFVLYNTDIKYIGIGQIESDGSAPRGIILDEEGIRYFCECLEEMRKKKQVDVNIKPM